MKKLIAGIALVGALALTGCGMYGKPTSVTEVRNFKTFVQECKDAGGHLEEGPKNWYTCDMSGAE